MREYVIDVEEVRVLRYSVMAEDEDHARELAWDKYNAGHDGKTVSSSEDIIDVVAY